MGDANVNLTIVVKNKTVEQIMPYLEWALDQRLEAVVSFDEEVMDPKELTSYQTTIQRAKEVYQQRNDLGSSFPTSDIPSPDRTDRPSGSESTLEAIQITGDGAPAFRPGELRG